MVSIEMQQLVSALNDIDSNGHLDLVLRLYEEESPAYHTESDQSDEEAESPPPYDTVLEASPAPPYEAASSSAPSLRCRKCHGRFASNDALTMTCPCHKGYIIGDGSYENSGVRGSWSCCGRVDGSPGCTFRYHKLGSRWSTQKTRLSKQLMKLGRLVAVR
ncbi:hypothetical protein BKA67DRAFT_539250 [Truncatella angustata]|uniref:Uncharacterized protein n=1 Tax=Truncatella angustata TaxID=152316 RepID=A0A9P8UD93_9PEZI|nr:uncharacterized protein BKA67DRAFT_539250 [Truncatella angustata]KAH6647377.1 hypothetical protein BKA67DRAFT_539250 [Truncatella angustata]KAH8203142.1 hypothetical protein TruAng_002663 [Truncatella angustata]